MLIAAVRDNGWLLFYGEQFSLPIMLFYKNLTTLVLMSQNFESILVCLFLRHQCKKIFKTTITFHLVF